MVANELLVEVQTGLRARKGQWKQIAADVPEASYSLIAQLGRGKYESEVAYSRLLALAIWLRQHPQAEGHAEQPIEVRPL